MKAPARRIVQRRPEALGDRMAERIKALVYLDAIVPNNGESYVSTLHKILEPAAAAAIVAGFRRPALEKRSGMMAPLPAAMLGITESKRDWIDRRCVPQSLATIEMPVLLSGRIDDIERRMYILADKWDPNFYRYFAAQCEVDPAWEVVKLPCGHDIMVDLPEDLAKTLARFGQVSVP